MKKPYVVLNQDVRWNDKLTLQKGTRFRVDRVNVYKDGWLDCTRKGTFGRVSWRLHPDWLTPENPDSYNLYVVTKKLTGD